MQNIPISLAKSGMVLAREIKSSDDPSSMTICGKGVKLTDSLLSRLQSMGVQALMVEGHPVIVEGEATLEQMLEALDKRFRRVENDPLMANVKEMYRKNMLRAMKSNDGR